MKNLLKKVTLLFIIVSLSTGCMKANVEMKINDNKSMDVTMFTALSDEFMKDLDEFAGEENELIDDEKKAEYESKGYEVIDYKENGYTGVKIIKHIKNIDTISDIDGANNHDLSSMFEENGQIQYYFTVNKGFFKNRYKAVFDSKDVNSNSDISQYENMDSDSLGISKEELEKYTKDIESNFKVILPMKALANNADNVSEDGLTLTWNLLNSSKETIEFEFEIINKGNTYSVYAAIGALILIFISTFFISTKKRKKKVKEVHYSMKNVKPNDLGEVDVDNNSMNNRMNEDLSI